MRVHTIWKTIIYRVANTKKNIKKTNNFQRENNHLTHSNSKQFTNTVKHKTHNTNTHIYRKAHKLQTTTIILNTTKVQEAIKQSKNNNSRSDTINIGHLKHIGPLGLTYLTINISLNNNIIPHT